MLISNLNAKPVRTPAKHPFSDDIPFNNFSQPTQLNKGFTLIELSIVLVIVSFLVAGILVGQTLIYTMTMRRAVSTIENYNSMANTFRAKYNCVPGDCANGAKFFLVPGSNPPTCGAFNGSSWYGCSGDGNNIVTGLGGNWTPAIESYVFWQHLKLAGLNDWMPKYFTPVNTCGTSENSAYPCFFQNSDKTNIIAGANPGSSVNRWWLFSSYHYSDSGLYNPSNDIQVGNVTRGLTSTDAYAIDSKIDDGLPLTGIMVAVDDTNVTLSVAGSVSYTPNNAYPCVSSATGNPYNMSQLPFGRNCLITIKAPF